MSTPLIPGITTSLIINSGQPASTPSNAGTEPGVVDYSNKGVAGLFNTKQVDKLFSILDDVRQRAAA